MVIENQSTKTGENVLFTKRLLAERGLDPRTFIVVQKPYMERRSYATFRKVWPEKELCVTSPRLSLDEYLEPQLPRLAVERRRHRHHGRRPAADPALRRPRLSDPSGDSR
jgi:hypothetical protein